MDFKVALVLAQLSTNASYTHCQVICVGQPLVRPVGDLILPSLSGSPGGMFQEAFL